MLTRAAFAQSARMDRAAVPLSAPVISGVLLPGNTITCIPGTYSRATDVRYTLLLNGTPFLNKVTHSEIEAFLIPPGGVLLKLYEHPLIGGLYQESNELGFYPELVAGSFGAYEIGRSPQTLSGMAFTGVIGDLSPEANDLTVQGAPTFEATGLNGGPSIMFNGSPDRAFSAAHDNGTGGDLTEFTIAQVVQDVTTTNGLFYLGTTNSRMAISQRTSSMRTSFPTLNLDAGYSPPALKFGLSRWNGATAEVFLDGVLINSAASVGAGPVDGLVLSWGSSVSPSSYANFRSSGLWLFSRALTDDELTHLIAYMRFSGKIP